MITPSDLIHLPYTPDLSEGGITYTCQSLTRHTHRMGSSSAGYLRRLAAGVAVELALRRYLSGQAIPFKVRSATPFSDPDHYSVSLGGHRCEVVSYLISRCPQIALLRKDPALLLQAPALLPVDQFASEDHQPNDLTLFAFLIGWTAAAREDTKKAIAAGQPFHLIHPLPESWARPSPWAPLERLSLKSECAAPVNIEIGGQDARRTFVTARLELPPRQRVLVEQDFHSLAYVHALRPPEARIGLHSPARGDPYIIQPHEWGDIWIDGKEILLAGWLTHEEFRQKATLLNAGMPVFQFARTREKNLLVPVAELNPLGILLEKVRAWESDKVPPRPSS
jgi:hypothetical protein